MKPDERIKDLYDKFSPYVEEKDFFGDNVARSNTKKCVLVAINSEYISLRDQLFNLRACRVIDSDKVYLYRLQKLTEEEQELISVLEDFEY